MSRVPRRRPCRFAVAACVSFSFFVPGSVYTVRERKSDAGTRLATSQDTTVVSVDREHVEEDDARGARLPARRESHGPPRSALRKERIIPLIAARKPPGATATRDYYIFLSRE